MGTELRTSYFAKYKGTQGVNIALKGPFWFEGESYCALYPKWSFLSKYKNDGNEQYYIKSYYDEVLNKLDPEETYSILKDKVLLCWCKKGKFCHRRLVAEWIRSELGIFVLEI